MATSTYGTGLRTDERNERGTRRTFTETKAFYKTSEFIIMLAGVIAVLAVTYLADGADGLTTWHGWLLVTIMASTYMFSRGIAKSGTREPYREEYDRAA